MPEFQVGGELDALSGGYVAVGHEDHVGDGPAGEHDTADQLTDEVQRRVLVRNGHDDADGNIEEGGYEQGEEEAVPGEVDFRIATL